MKTEQQGDITVTLLDDTEPQKETGTVARDKKLMGMIHRFTERTQNRLRFQTKVTIMALIVAGLAVVESRLQRMQSVKLMKAIPKILQLEINRNNEGILKMLEQADMKRFEEQGKRLEQEYDELQEILNDPKENDKTKLKLVWMLLNRMSEYIVENEQVFKRMGKNPKERGRIAEIEQRIAKCFLGLESSKDALEKKVVKQPEIDVESLFIY